MERAVANDPVERVEEALRERGHAGAVLRFAATTHTAEDAARAAGSELGQIVKSMFFTADGDPVIVLAAGDRRVDTALLAGVLGVGRKRVKMGTPEVVRQTTGFEVGGVPPLGHETPCRVLIDESLRRYERLWAAAGSANAVFETAPGELDRMTGGAWAAVTREG